MQGLKSADFNLLDLARLYGAGRWQILWRVQLPSALPALLTGMKIGGVIALIGEVVAEFVAGSGTASRAWPGGSWKSGSRLEIPTLFAALALPASPAWRSLPPLSLQQPAGLARWR